MPIRSFGNGEATEAIAESAGSTVWAMGGMGRVGNSFGGGGRLLHLADEATHLVKNTTRDSVAANGMGMVEQGQTEHA